MTLRDVHTRDAVCAGLACVLLLCATEARAEGADAGTREMAPGTVTYYGEPVIPLTESVFGSPPSRRAADITARLQRHLRSPLFRTQDIRVEDHDEFTTVFWKDELLFSIADADAVAAKTTRTALAESAVAALREALLRSEVSRAPKTLLLDVAYALATTLILVLA